MFDTLAWGPGRRVNYVAESGAGSLDMLDVDACVGPVEDRARDVLLRESAAKRAALNIVQVTPTSYTADGVIGGGERIVLYLDKALNRAAAAQGINLQTTIISLDGASVATPGLPVQTVAGTAWRPQSVAAKSLIERLRPADVVYIHQCMTEIGLFTAAHAKLLAKRVFGLDSGAGEASILQLAPEIMRIYSGLHSQSEYAALSFSGFDVPIHVVPGPIDTESYMPEQDVERDSLMVVCIGRVLPHKGFERVIQALPPQLSLRIVGQHYDSAYLAFLRDCVQGKNVTFLADLDDAAVRRLLLRAGLFVHPSTHTDYQGRFYHKPELLGLAPLEAIASGVTTLVSNAGALRELGKLPGCYVFNDDAELASLLRSAACNRLPHADPAAMYRGVTDKYGLVAVGTALLRIMDGTAPPCAS